MTTNKHSFVDLSHDIHSGMITYPGLPAPVITDHMSRQQSRSHYAAGTEFHIGKIEMVGAPFKPGSGLSGVNRSPVLGAESRDLPSPARPESRLKEY